MTLTAIRKNTGERISLVGIDKPRQEINWEGCFCPVTDLPVIPVTAGFRNGSKVTSHWRVKGKPAWLDNTLPDNEYGRDIGNHLRLGESIYHMEGKLVLLKEAHKLDPDCTPSLGCLEYRIWMPNREKYRIADVAFIFPSGLISVYEIQLADIGITELTDRTLDYFEAGVDVQWCFGESMFKDTTIDWHQDIIGRSPCRICFDETESEYRIDPDDT